MALFAAAAAASQNSGLPIHAFELSGAPKTVDVGGQREGGAQETTAVAAENGGDRDDGGGGNGAAAGASEQRADAHGTADEQIEDAYVAAAKAKLALERRAQAEREQRSQQAHRRASASAGLFGALASFNKSNLKKSTTKVTTVGEVHARLEAANEAAAAEEEEASEQQQQSPGPVRQQQQRSAPAAFGGGAASGAGARVAVDGDVPNTGLSKDDDGPGDGDGGEANLGYGSTRY